MTIKTITLLFTLFLGTQAIGQEMFDVKHQAQNNIKVLKEKIEKEMPDAKLTAQQLVKLEKIYMDLNKEKEALIKNGTPKHEYAKAIQKLENQFNPLITEVLTTEQKIAYNRSKEHKQ